MSQLIGTELLGRIYDIHGRYARAESTGTQLFDFPSAPARSVEIYGKSYTHPQVMQVTTWRVTGKKEHETRKTKELSRQFEVNLHAKAGISGVFGGELRARYEEKSVNNVHFLHVAQRGVVHAYRIALPSVSELKRYLNPEVRTAINDRHLDPGELIRNYGGSHFLNVAVFGGEWTFTQSVSSYEYSSEWLAEEHVEGNLAGLFKAGVDTTYAKSERNTVSETDATWWADGGRPETLCDFEAWTKSVGEGEFAFVDFDPKENPLNDVSLQPIALLADDPARQRAIQAAIQDYIENGRRNLVALRWHQPQVFETGRGGTDLEVKLTDPHKVIVGFGATVHTHKGRVTHLAAKWLDLHTNETGWIWDPRSGVRTFNRSDYEMIYPGTIADDSGIKGYVLTLLKLRAEGGSLHDMEMLYQKIDPANLEGAYHISSRERSLIEIPGPRSSGWDRIFDPGEGWVIVGIGLSYHSDGWLPQLRVTAARLTLESVSQA